MATHDLVVRGGLVVDGSGTPGRPADVAISGGVITHVQPSVVGRGAREIDASGRFVTPGWVDVHTHYDAQVSWDPWLTPSSWHGVTTAVMGNCGVGFAPADPSRHAWLIELMEGVEDIPGSAMAEGITWDWETFPEYLDAVARVPRVLDVGAQIGHGPLRAYVMGERGALNEEATPDDIDQMSLLVEQALRAGALGFSSSRTPIHRSKSGELVPGTSATTDELLGIADALRRAGHGVFQFAAEHVAVPGKEWGWMRDVARRTGRTISVNLNQPDDGPDVWREVLHLLDEAQRDGLAIVAQVAGRSIGILMCLHGTLHPLLFHPAYSEVAHLAVPERVAALNEPERRRRIINEVPDDGGSFSRFVSSTYGRMFPVADGDIDYEPPPEDSIAARAADAGVPPMQLVLDQLLAHDGHGMLYFPLFNYAYGDLSMTYEAHRHPGTRMGLGDAGAHCGAICDGGTPTFMLTHWVRDRSRGPRLPLELVVQRQTRQTAELYGLLDRGLLSPGYKADLNVFDLGSLAFEPPRMAFDFPSNARRLVQRASGYHATICSGVLTVEDDVFTGALPGGLVRGPRAGSTR
jgi:N-acyl-D-amino-acid deacylase